MTLTDDYSFVSQYNLLAAEVMRDKRLYSLSKSEIAKYRNMEEVEVEELYKIARCLSVNKKLAWMYGLSNRAIRALVKNDYLRYEDLYHDIYFKRVDLEVLPLIGHKVAVEISDWVYKNEDRFL